MINGATPSSCLDSILIILRIYFTSCISIASFISSRSVLKFLFTMALTHDDMGVSVLLIKSKDTTLILFSHSMTDNRIQVLKMRTILVVIYAYMR